MKMSINVFKVLIMSKIEISNAVDIKTLRSLLNLAFGDVTDISELNGSYVIEVTEERPAHWYSILAKVFEVRYVTVDGKRYYSKDNES